MHEHTTAPPQGVRHPPDSSFDGGDRFDVLHRLGGGGMGVVYEVFDRDRGTRMALKTLRRLGPDSLLMFKNEFRSLQDIRHPNLVKLGELLEHRGSWFFTMELIEGVDILRYVRPEADEHRSDDEPSRADSETHPTAPLTSPNPRDEAPGEAPAPLGFDESRLRDALCQLAQGLVALHRERKVHRDIKPSNVLVTEQGRVVIVDFGIVEDADQASVDRVIGTYAFMAPEQAQGRPVGEAADWYSVGTMLYLMLTGAMPFRGHREDVLYDKLARDGGPPSARTAGVPRDLDDLCVALLQRDPTARPTGAQILSTLGVRDSAPPIRTEPGAFVGRDVELARLRELMPGPADAAATVLLRGASGVGKSALTAELARRVAAAHSDAIVVSGRCYERETVPFKAFDEMVDGLCRFLDDLPSSEAEELATTTDLAELVPVFPVLRRLAHAADAPRATGLDPTARRRAVFDALRRILARLGSERPLLVIIDDLQWADPDSVALLRALRRPPDAPRMLLVATVRTDPSEPSLQLDGDIHTLDLGALPAPDARSLAETLWKDSFGDIDSAGVDAVTRDARGHPLFLAALIRQQRSRGDATTERGRLDDLIWSEVQGLDAPGRRLIELLAVAEKPLTQIAAAHAGAFTLATLADLAAELTAARLVTSTGARRNDRMQLYHDRVRESLLARLPRDVLSRWHLRLARAYERVDSSDFEALARHWRGADRPLHARQYLLQAAAAARDKLAFDHSARLYRAALELFDPGDADTPNLHADLGDALASAGRGAEAAEAFLVAARSAPAAAATELRRRAADQLLMSGHIDAGLDVDRQVLAPLGIALPATPRRALLALIGRRIQLRTRGLRFRRRDETTIAPRRLLAVDAIWGVAAGLAGVDMVRGAYAQTLGLLAALSAGEPYRVARALSLEAALTAVAGPRARARSSLLLEQLARIADEIQHPHAIGLSHGASGVVAWFEGRFSDSIESCDRAERVFRSDCTGVAWEIATAELFAMLGLHRLGRLDRMRPRVARQLTDAEERGNLYAITNLKGMFAPILHLADDDVADARAAVDQALRGWSHQGYHVQHYNVMHAHLVIDLYEGRGANAFERIADAWPQLEGALLLGIHQMRVEAHWLRAGAALAAAGGCDDARRRELLAVAERDVRALHRARSPWGKLLAALATAAIAHRRGDDANAIAELRDVIPRLDEAKYSLLAAAARWHQGMLEGGEAGATLSRAARSAFEQLTIVAPAPMAAAYVPGFD